MVATAALLWATDALVRYPAIRSLDPTFIVFFEHILAVLILLPWVLYKYPKRLFDLNFTEWLTAIFSGIGGSALATIFFTASFLYINPSVSVLLQKLQPIFVVLIAFAVLGERPKRSFYFWAIIALSAGIVLTFPDLQFRFLLEDVNLTSRGFHYAFGAAFLWAASTVTGKFLLKRTPVVLATFWRFFFGLVGLLAILGVSHNPDLQLITDFHFISKNAFPLFYLSLIPGMFAMMVYYGGLARTPASATTFIELIYPIGAIILNTVFLHTPLETVQTGAGIMLLFAVAMISF